MKCSALRCYRCRLLLVIMDMTKKAVDIVLLPDKAMTDRVIGINAELVKNFGKEIVLNKADCLPHISLAMGCADEGDIDVIKAILEIAAQESSFGDLRIVGIRTSTNSAGRKVSVFEVEKTQQLQLLHEKVMNRLEKYLSDDITESMVYGDRAVADSTLEWIKSYREKSSFSNFFAHITIGYGEGIDVSLPIEFAVSKLALCHLGNHCTCRKVLASVELSAC